MNPIDRLQEANAAIRRSDPQLRDELERVAPELVERDRPDVVERVTEAFDGSRPALAPAVPEEQLDAMVFETVVLRTGRPVLAIKRDRAELTFDDADSEVWRTRLEAASELLVDAARAVGRIEVEGHPLAWLGTGWLVAPDVVVTNRHVAAEFGRRNRSSYTFRPSLAGGAMRASIDLLEEIDREESRTFELREILHIEDPDGPDLAFLRVDGDVEVAPIALASTSQVDDFVAVIGYPARDSRIPDVALMDQIFGNVYDKKRLAPGQLIEPGSGVVRHDCSTLGGNSGSVVLSLDTGEAVGLHFAGRFLEANFAVPSAAVGDRLADLGSGRIPRRPPPAPTEVAPAAIVPAAGGPTSRTYLVPLTITVDLGEPFLPAGGATASPQGGAGPTDGFDGQQILEAAPEDYLDREGYDPAFLGDGLEVPLPELTGAVDDILTFRVGDRDEQVLAYEHFSVVMSEGRRLCRFSAVNIDGNLEKRFARVAWRTDPRVPKQAQIKSECYGNPPRFARGHMTRREDPIWGSDEAASRGNADSMHVTNAVPQMQPFNAGVWLDLEDYALQNARRDDMKISVFTGPFLEPDDPTRFGVQIPVEFWKVIAFVHDETGELCATGYTMSQRAFLSEDELVFGSHETAQTSIASIEHRAGISFGPLAAVDPFEGLEGFISRLDDASQIQLVRRFR